MKRQRSASPFVVVTLEEITATEEACCALRNQDWAKPLIKNFRKAGGISKANLSLMFELRYARTLFESGVVPCYEKALGVGNTTVDFCFENWQVELYCLSETEAAIDATCERGNIFSRVLAPPLSIHLPQSQASSDLDEKQKKQSVAGETLQTIQRLLNKVSNGDSPLKFPLPKNTYSMLAVDIRCLFDGHCDAVDLDLIAYGANAVDPEIRLHWPASDGSVRPLLGLFDPANTSAKAKHFQERVHFVSFILEQTYELDELRTIGYYYANPHLFDNEKHVYSALRTFPLISTTRP
jgi:hypothetical protein